MEDVAIGDTVADPEAPDALPRIEIEEPTVRMTFGVNTSPFAGREGKFSTTRQLGARLYKELDTNLGLHVADTDVAERFLLSGRGELHLAVLIETMRREGYEFEVSRPEAIIKVINGQRMEPVEHLTVDVREENVGGVTEALGKRRGEMIEITYDKKGGVRLEYMIPTRGLIGFRNTFLTLTAGTGLMGSIGIGYRPWVGEFREQRNGALTASSAGKSLAFGLAGAQERGTTFIEPVQEVYEGMIVGIQKRPGDIRVNVCREKKQSNIRSSTSDISVRLTPASKLSLEQSLDFLADDELLEVTPKHLRLRKRHLTEVDQSRARRVAEAARGFFCPGGGASPFSSCASFAGRNLMVEFEAAVAVHLDDPHRLLDVMRRGELELAQRGLDVHALHRGAQLVAVTNDVCEGELGAPRSVGEDLDSGVALRRELVRVLAVLGLIRAHEVGVGGKRVADVPRARAASTPAGRAGLHRHPRRVETVAAKEMALPAQVPRSGHDRCRYAAERRDEDHVRVHLHSLSNVSRQVGVVLAEGDRLEQLNVVRADRVLNDLAAVARELVVLRDQ